MGIRGMKLHHSLTPGFWTDHQPSSFSNLDCKRLRPLPAAATVNLKSFIRPESGPRRIGSSDSQNKESAQVETTQPGGTRWNPTQEQIALLETLYRRGMRTPNAQQIEHITAQLRKYGKIEGKNVFYWFQNHKARERQKQKRNNLGLISHGPRTPSASSNSFVTAPSLLLSAVKGADEIEEQSFDSKSCKRKCRSWTCLEEEEDNRYGSEEDGQENRMITLKLFPLHPEGSKECD